MAGVSKPAITQAVKRGTIVPTADGNIDLDHQTNSMYLDSRAVGSGTRGGAQGGSTPADTPDSVSPSGPNRPQKTAKGRKTSRKSAAIPTLPDVDTPDVALADMAEEIDLSRPERYINSYGTDLVARDKAAQTLQRIAAIRASEQKRRRDEGELLDRDAVASQIAVFGSALHTNLLQLPKRITPRIVALARSGEDRAVEEKLRDEIASAIEKAQRDLVVPE